MRVKLYDFIEIAIVVTQHVAYDDNNHELLRHSAERPRRNHRRPCVQYMKKPCGISLYLHRYKERFTHPAVCTDPSTKFHLTPQQIQFLIPGTHPQKTPTDSHHFQV